VPSDPDAIWKRGYDGPAPTSPGSVEFEPSPSESASPASSAQQRTGRGRRVAIGGSLLTVIAVAAVAVSIRSGDDAEVAAPSPTAVSPTTDPSPLAPPVVEPDEPDPVVAAALPSPLDVVALTGEPFAGAEPRRLPERVDELWRYRIDTVDGDTDRSAATAAQVEVIDSRYVAVIVGVSALGTERSTLSLLDATNGEEQWTVELFLGHESFDVIGATDSTLLVESFLATRPVVGFDLDTGVERWTMIESNEQLEAHGGSSGFELLRGTPFLARRPTVATNPTLLFDPETGTEVGRLDGEIIGTDHLGTYYVDVDDAIAVYDLSEEFGPMRLASVAAADPGDPVSVVDGKVVIVANRQNGRPGGVFVGIDPNGSFVGVLDPADRFGAEPGVARLPGVIANIAPMIGSTVIVSGSGQMTGAELDGDEIRPAWQRDGIVSRTVQTERGTVILASQNGGATQALVDGRTGATITVLTMTPGVLDRLEFAGNGVLTRRTSGDGNRVAAIDLDGNEIWSLPGSAPVALGDGVVARLETSTDEAVVVGYGSDRSATVAW
jgi:outer membrane protein assembly factor BamB